MKSAGRAACLAAMLISVLLAGCYGLQERKGSVENPVPSNPSNRVNLTGYSQAFRTGYADGCDSAGVFRRRDEGRYKSDGDYMMGWNDGYGACSRKR